MRYGIVVALTVIIAASVLCAVGDSANTANITQGGFISMSNEVAAVPTVGRIVHYVDMMTSVHRAAIVIEASNTMSPGLNVQNPGEVIYRSAVHYDEKGRPGTWHWPERD